MNTARRRLLGSLPLALSLATLAFSAASHAGPLDTSGLRSGMVFTSSNDMAGNSLLAYARAPGGSLMLQAQVATGGLGTSASLGSQGAVTLSRDGRFVFVVNAGDHTVSTFELAGNELRLTSTVAAGGLHPISVTEHGGLVYVLNDGGDGNIAGFRNRHGMLAPVAGSMRGLSVAGGATPGQIGFSADGRAIVVTEKGTNRLSSYRIRPDGSADAPLVTASPGLTPYGFGFNTRNRLVVSEAQGGVAGASTLSSYRFAHTAPAQPMLVSASVPDTQTAACWVAISVDGRWAFTTNAGSSSVSSYRIAPDGQITLAHAVAGSTGDGSSPTDVAVSADGGHLYVRNGRTYDIASFHVNADGSLAARPATPGLPTTAVGLAAN
jgi:6-phosphogluconolactonase (cycloisomerase 2 family)